MSKEGITETVQIPHDFSGKRADITFSRLLTGHTRSQIRKLIEEGLILVEGRRTKPSKKLRGGETVSITLLPPQPIEAKPQDISIEILFEDDDLLVVNKPPGLTVHPGAGTRDGTLVNALLFRCTGLSGIGGKIRPGIVHRLDKDTSGVMVVAKNDFAHHALTGQFKSREVKKRYLALVSGKISVESGSFTSPIGRHPTNRIKMSTKAKTAKEALTLWRVVKRYANVTMVEAEPKTGRTHQIRVHFAENGHPVLCDRIYGNKKPASNLYDSVSKKIGRQALHASTIGFSHPRTGEYVEFQASVPDDMKELIDILNKQCRK